MVRKTNYDTKISELEKKLTDRHNKYIATPEFNTLAASVFDARVAKANLITKIDFGCQHLREKLHQINQNICLLKIN